MSIGLPADMRINLERSRVLLVDDNPQALEVQSAMIRGFGVHRQLRASSAKEAMDIVQRAEIDLIIMDCQMPDMDGYDFVRWLRREAPPTANFIPVIMITGHAARGTVEKSRDCGANFILAAPFTPQVLLQRIFWVAKDEREFVRCAAYVGPDRRFRNLGPPPGVKPRRSTDVTTKLGAATQPNLGQDDIDLLLKPQRVNL